MPNRSDASLRALSVEEVMSLASKGDRAAFERVFELTRGSILRAITCATGDGVLAEDVAQDTFIKVWHARASYQAGMPVLPWVRTIARRALIDSLRRARHERERLRALRGTPETVHPRFEELIDARRASDRTMAALQALPPKQAQALFAVATRGPSLSDLARRAGDSPLAMRLRVHRAREALRKSVGVFACAAE